MKLLVIEDCKKLSDLIKEAILRTFKVEDIYTVDNGMDAIKIGNEKDINLIIADIGLPDFSGIDVIKRLREHPKHYMTPVIFITADATKELEAYRFTHCHSYLTKPFSETTLISVVSKLMDSWETTKPVSENKLLLKFRTHNQWINEKDIYFVEYLSRKIRIHFDQSYIDYKSMPLKDFAILLSDQFLQIHQSIIVNREKIKAVNFSDKLIHLQGQKTELPIGRNFTQSVKEYFSL